MIVDPFGDVLAECRTLGNDVAIATCSHDKIAKSGGHRYREARRPGLVVHDSGIGGPRPYAGQWHRLTRTTE